MHLIGGGYINSVWPYHLGLLRAALRLRDVSGARLAATGLGLTPETHVDELAKSLNAFDHVSVRDQPSADLIGVESGVDDAFLYLQGVPGFRDGTRDDDVWVCLQNDMTDAETFDAAVEAVRAALTRPELEGRTVRYLEGMPHMDRYAYDKLSDLIPEENFYPFVRVWQEGFPARAGQTWLTSRFHAHLLAAACGAEGTALVINDNYRMQHQSLVEAGSGWTVTEQGSSSITAPSGASAFRGGAARLRQAKVREAESLYPEVSAPEPEKPTESPESASRSRGLLRRR